MSDTLHVSPVSTFPFAAGATYLSLQDQEGERWYLWVSQLPEMVLSRTPPPGIELASRRVFAWLRWLSPDGRGWYVYPTTWGELAITNVRPAGDGTGEVFDPWWSADQRAWALSLTDLPELKISGDGQVVLAYAHTIMACRTCQWVGHVDRSNGRRGPEGELMRNRCPVDGTPFYPLRPDLDDEGR